MVITDLPCLISVFDLNKVVGGQKYSSYDNRASAVALTYADGLDVLAVAGTSVFIDRGVSQSNSFSVAQSSS